MKWNFWIDKYINNYCTARGLMPKTIKSYHDILLNFHLYMSLHKSEVDPDWLKTKDILEYVNFLRDERKNGIGAVNKQVVVVKGFYKAMVSMEEILPDQNPMNYFPKMKSVPRKTVKILSDKEVLSMVNLCDMDTIIGIRDRALVILLYGTGIRASECSQLKEVDIDFDNRYIYVKGKGGHERTVPLNEKVVDALMMYKEVRGDVSANQPFFRSRNGNGMSRNTIYERIRRLGGRAGIKKKVSPHKLRHTFASHLIKEGQLISVVQELLGHKSIVSTQVYIHIAGEEMRKAIDKHPMNNLLETIIHKMPDIRFPFQKPKNMMTG